MTKKLEMKVADEADESQAEPVSEPSALASELKALKERIFSLASSREKLPQPLFWSLFRLRISSLKKKKEKDRLLDDILG